MTIKLSTEELAAELSRRQQQEQEEQQHQTDAIRQAQQDWSEAILKAHKAREDQLEEEGRTSMAAAEKAVQDGDLAAAFLGYTSWHSSRMARYYLRLAAQNAVNRVPNYNGPAIPDLRLIDVAFPEWLNEQCSKLSSRNGAERYEATLGAEIPTSIEEAEAWLKAKQG